MHNLLFRVALNYNSLPGSSSSVNGSNLISNVMKLVFGLIGVTSVLIITLAGIQYVISNGEPQKTAKAKNTIIYALVGLAVAILGSVIVNFVVGQLG